MKSSVAFLRDHVLPASLCFGLAIVLMRIDALQRIEWLTLDQRTHYRAAHQPPADERVAVVGIDDTSIAENAFGRWPWSRNVHGSFLYLLNKEKPTVVALDILFTEPDVVDPSNDVSLIAGTKAATDMAVVFAAESADDAHNSNPASITRPLEHIDGDATLIPSTPFIAEPLPALTSLARIGLADTPPGTDGVRRHAYLLNRIGDRVFPNLTLQALLAYWKVSADAVRVRLGDAIYFSDGQREHRIPIDERGRYFINYRRGPRDALSYSYYTLYQGLEARHVARERTEDLPNLTGKILLVGQVADGLADFGPTPLGALTPLVFVHVNAVENILRDDYVRRPTAGAVWSVAFLVSVVGLALFSSRKFPLQVAFSLGVPVLYVLVAFQLWASASIWLPLVGPLLGFGAVQAFMVGRRVVQEQRAKAEIKGLFGTYVSPAVVHQIVESGKKPELGGHEQEITAYFSDIQGFSSFSEILPPAQLVRLMNEYLTACTDIITEEGGTLDKYIGDAVVAMFGAPIALSDHAYRACVASQRVQQRLGELRVKWRAEGTMWPDVVRQMQSRIGLNSGAAIIGNMGSRTRFNYTMTGDNVNLAARMESGAKQWGVYTMCTEATKLACERHGGDRVVFRPLGRIQVVGRARAVPIFEVAGLKETTLDATRECIASFEAALEKYYARDWDGARAGFTRSAELEPNQPGKTPGVKSNPSLVYARIAQQYRSSPPPSDWDGVYVMPEK
jgi:adenylate cyclase